MGRIGEVREIDCWDNAMIQTKVDSRIELRIIRENTITFATIEPTKFLRILDWKAIYNTLQSEIDDNQTTIDNIKLDMENREPRLKEVSDDPEVQNRTRLIFDAQERDKIELGRYEMANEKLAQLQNACRAMMEFANQ